MSRNTITELNLSALKVHPRNEELFPDMKGEAFERFKQSISEKGIVQPICVAADMTIISGHQRYRAAMELGLDKVPVVIKEDVDNEDEKALQLIISNFQRSIDEVNKGRWIAEYERLRGVRQGSAYKKAERQIVAQVSQEDIAAELGVDVRTLQRLKKLNDLIPELKESIISGHITASTGYTIISKLPEDEQHKLYEQLEALPEAKKFTQKQVQAYIDQIHGLETKNKALEDAKKKAVESSEKMTAEATEAMAIIKASKDAQLYMEMKQKKDKAEEEQRTTFEKFNTYKTTAIAEKQALTDKVKKLEAALKKANEPKPPVIQKETERVEVYPDDYEKLKEKALQYDAFIASREKATDFMPQLSVEDEQRNYENNLTNSVSAFASEIEYLLEDKHRVAMLTPVEKEMYIKDMRRIIDFANEMLVELKKNKEVA